MTEKEYRELPNDKYFNFSLLSSFSRLGPKVLLENDKKETKALKLGSLYHTLLFFEDYFEDTFYISKVEEELTATSLRLMNSMLPRAIEELDIKDIFEENENFIKLCLSCIKENNFWSNIVKEDLLIAKFLDDNFKNNLAENIIGNGKTIVTTEEYLHAQLACKVLREHPFTKEYLISNDLKKKQILFEHPVLFKIKDVNYKVLLDIILIDHENKTIRQLDFKTGEGDFKKFIKSFFEYRYDIQAALYTRGLEEYIIKKGIKDYTILDPIYLYVNKNDVENPLPIFMDRNIVNGGFYGFHTSTGKKYKGILDLVEEIQWHRSNNLYDYSKDIYLEKGLSLKDHINTSSFAPSYGSNSVFNNYGRETLSSSSRRLQDQLSEELRRITEERRRSANRDGMVGTMQRDIRNPIPSEIEIPSPDVDFEESIPPESIPTVRPGNGSNTISGNMSELTEMPDSTESIRTFGTPGSRFSLTDQLRGFIDPNLGF